MSNKRQTNNQSRHERRRARREEQRIAAQRAAERQRRLTILGGAASVALIVAIVLIVINLPDGADDLPPVAAATPMHQEIQSEGRILGELDAPVTVVEWSDFQCPECATFAQEAQPQLVRDYVSTGQVRFEYRDFAILGDESVRAAEAASCAADQGLFWAYHDTLFANQHGQEDGAFSDDRLREMAEQLDLEMDQFSECFDNRLHEVAVAAQRDEAAELGINSTPTFVVNGAVMPYEGYDALSAAIETELNG